MRSRRSLKLSHTQTGTLDYILIKYSVLNSWESRLTLGVSNTLCQYEWHNRFTRLILGQIRTNYKTDSAETCYLEILLTNTSFLPLVIYKCIKALYTKTIAKRIHKGRRDEAGAVLVKLGLGTSPVLLASQGSICPKKT